MEARRPSSYQLWNRLRVVLPGEGSLGDLSAVRATRGKSVDETSDVDEDDL